MFFALTFIDVAARDAYPSHAQHLAFVELLKPYLVNLLVFDYELLLPSTL